MDGIAIREAAQRLGVSVESLRKRAQRGTITAYKTDGGWFVVLPDAQDVGQDIGQDGVHVASEPVAALVDQLTFLQRELERRNLEIERLTGMLAESQRTVRLLLPASTGQGQDSNAGASVEESKPSNISPMSRPPQAPDRRREEFPVESPETPHRGSQRVQRGLWQRIADALRGPS